MVEWSVWLEKYYIGSVLSPFVQIKKWNLQPSVSILKAGLWKSKVSISTLSSFHHNELKVQVSKLQLGHGGHQVWVTSLASDWALALWSATQWGSTLAFGCFSLCLRGIKMSKWYVSVQSFPFKQLFRVWMNNYNFMCITVLISLGRHRKVEYNYVM